MSDFVDEVRKTFGMPVEEKAPMNEKPKKQKLGALWVKNIGGKEVFSGTYQPEGKNGPSTRIEIWPNGFKNKPNDPDRIIYLDTFVPK